MLTVAVVLSLCLLIVLILQVYWSNQFVGLYRQIPARMPAPVPDEALPHVGVVLSLRGADPFLRDCLRGLFALDYPSFEIRIIVDNEADAALPIVREMVQQGQANHVTVELLNVCQATSSLKNAALVQAIDGCSDRCTVYAWLDSDTIPYPNWLRDLCAPLKDDSVGAACGIRWYAPPSNTLANHVRHLWNSAALLQMQAFSIGWGGAFAITRSFCDTAGLKEKWRRALVEDTLTSSEVLKTGKSVRFVAAATMPNAESTSLAGCISFVTRQLQSLMYYHHAWRRVVSFGLFGGVIVGTMPALAAAALVQGDAATLILILSSLGVFGGVLGWLMHRGEKVVREALRQRYELPLSHWMMLVAAAPVTQVIHLLALCRALLTSEVTWRGITYRIRSGLDINRLNYSAYFPSTSAGAESI